MLCETLPVGLIGANCVILGDEDSKEAVVIDPGGEAPQILVRLADLGLTVTALVHTHGHVDHVSGAGEMRRVTGAPVYLNEEDRPLFDRAGQQAAMFGMPQPEPCEIDHGLEDGAELSFGSHSFSVLHTPGHSPGSVSLFLEKERLCIVGDTLFAGGVGRTDLWGGSFEVLERSIRERLYTLPPETRIIPGHGPETTVDMERQTNPFVRL